MYRNADQHPKIPLRRALILPFVLQIFLAVGLTGYLSLQSGQKAVNDIAAQLRYEIATRIEQNLQVYLATPHLVNQINADAVSLDQLNLEDMAAWERHIWRQKKQFGSLNGITIINEKGKGVSVISDDAGKLVIQATNQTEENQVVMYLAGSQGERLKVIKVFDFDPRKITAYQETIEADKPIWTKISFGEIIKTPIVTAGLPIYNKSNRAIGASLSTLRLSLIGDFLQTLKVGKTGQTFIIEQDGMLVATSTVEKPYRNQKRFSAVESENILTQATARYLKERFNNLYEIKDPQLLEFLLDGRKQFVEVFPFQDTRGIDWLIVISIPEDDFLGQINTNRHTTILLCLLALALATTLGIKTAQWITRPIQRLGEVASAIAIGEFEQKSITSPIKEVSALSTSFNRMSQQLKQSYKQLEDYSRLLEQKVAERTQKLEQEIRDRQKIQDNLRESEERYQLTLESVNDGIWDWRIKPNTVYFSPQWKAMLGYQDSEIPNEPSSWNTLVHPKDLPLVMDSAAEHLRSGSNESYSWEFRMRHKNGSYRWILSRGRVVERDKDGQALRLVGSHADISDRKQIEQQLRTSLKEKEALLREVYHRVKNNMQLVSSLLNLQADTVTDPDVLRLLNESQQRVKTMALIHERLYRSENLAHINAATYIRDLVNNLMISHGASNFSIQANLDVAELELDLDIAIPCGLIINELVSNALKYAFPNKQGEIDLRFGLDKADNYCLIVKDDGIGISSDIELHNTETLGMQLVYGLTEQLGGVIELDRREGSQFKITFRKRH